MQRSLLIGAVVLIAAVSFGAIYWMGGEDRHPAEPTVASEGSVEEGQASAAGSAESEAPAVAGQSVVRATEEGAEMLTGEPPFQSEMPEKLAKAHIERPAPNPRRVLPGLCTGITKLLQSMLAKEPLRRPDANELVAQLAELEIATLEERVAG